MRAYVDASCIVAIAFSEPGEHGIRRRLERCDSIHASNLLEAEVRAAYRRQHVVVDQRLLARIEWILPDRSLSTELERVFQAGELRGADAWHLASALYFAPAPSQLPFITLDERQAEVAAALGFPT